MLIVDDSSAHPVTLRGMLLKLGYRVISVDSGQAAIETLRRERVDAVLLACPLAHVTGSSMSNQLLTLAACARLPVLALFESQAQAEQACDKVEGVTGYLIKPLRFEALQQALSAHLMGGFEGKSAEG